MTIAEQITRAKADYDEVYQAGKKAEYDAFWDSFQKNGEIIDGTYAFAGWSWNDMTYNPKYPIKFSSCTSAFRGSYMHDAKVPIDLSEGSGTYLFFYSTIRKIPKIIVNENIVYTSWFVGCTGLEEVYFEGVIGQNGLNLYGQTKLSHDSIVSIINALSTTTSGLAVELSKTAVNKAFETSEGANDGSTSTEWTTLIATKSNWTISLV